MKIKAFFFQMTIFGNVKILQPYLLNPARYFVQIFSIFQTYYLLLNDRKINVETYMFQKLHFPDLAYLGDSNFIRIRL